jgi:hypothetical protein
MSGDFKLPELEQRYIRGYHNPIEYFIDPAFLKALGEGVLQQIVQIELRFQADVAKLQAQKFSQMADTLGK